MRHAARTLLALSLLFVITGCAATHADPAAEPFGKTYYLDGAGNWGFGANGVPTGLREAGYRGDVEHYVWTTTYSPLLDQWNTSGAKRRGAELAQRIREYRAAHPDNAVNIVALSAGTGVAVWAVEDLDENCKIDNLVLLASSLSHDYDISRALAHVSGRIYVYCSQRDGVLRSVPLIGTIDGRRGVAAAGQVGLTPPPLSRGRVVNVEWDPSYTAYGWSGGHTDCTSQPFVRQILARHVVSSQARLAAQRRTARTGRATLAAYRFGPPDDGVEP